MFHFVLIALLLPCIANAQCLPDLVIDLLELESTLQVDTVTTTDACLVDGGCIPSLGEHMLLRFATRTHNIAPTGCDLVIGSPPANPATPPVQQNTMSSASINTTWFFHPCHNHFHILNYVSAQLLLASDMSNATELVKHSFCIADTACTRGGVVGGYTCGNQGLTAGCHDTYSTSTPCQWVVIDGLPTNVEYILRLKVDPANFIPEGDETNNCVETRFKLEDLMTASSAALAVSWYALATSLYILS